LKLLSARNHLANSICKKARLNNAHSMGEVTQRNKKDLPVNDMLDLFFERLVHLHKSGENFVACQMTGFIFQCGIYPPVQSILPFVSAH